jgi:stage II sporulation protein M
MSAIKDSFIYFKNSLNYIYFTVFLFILFGLFGFIFVNSLGFLSEIIENLVLQAKDLKGISLIWFIFKNNISSAFFALVFGSFFAILPIINSILNGVLIGYVISIASTQATAWEIFLSLAPHGIFELPAIFISIGLGIKLGISFFIDYFAFYKKKRNKKLQLWISIVLFVIGLIFTLYSTSFIQTNSSKYLLFSTIGFLLSAQIFFVLFRDSRFRKIEFKEFYKKIKASLIIFFLVVLPLLIIAAIIEGILITLYK